MWVSRVLKAAPGSPAERAPEVVQNNEFRTRIINIDTDIFACKPLREGRSATRVAAIATFSSRMSMKPMRNSFPMPPKCFFHHFGYQILASRYQIPDPGFQILATTSWLPDPGYQTLATRSGPQDPWYQILATTSWPPDTGYQILASSS